MGVFADLRTDVTDAVLAAAKFDDTWNVHPLPVDALTPPAFLIEWADPWGPGKATACQYDTSIQVRCVSGRIDPDPGIEVLELMVEGVVAQLDKARFPILGWTPPRPVVIGGVAYLSAVVLTRHTVTIVAPEPPPIRGRATLSARAWLVADGQSVPAAIHQGVAALTATATLGAVGKVVPASIHHAAAAMTATARLAAAGHATPGTWSPSALPGITGWFDADNAASITHNAGAVSQWSDGSGRGHHLVQGTGGGQPQTGVRTIGGRNTLKFSPAGSNHMAAAGIAMAGTKTIIAVWLEDAAINHTLVGSDAYGTLAIQNVPTWSPAIGGPAQHMVFTKAGVAQLATSLTDIPVGTPQVAVTEYVAGVSQKFWRNGVADGEAANTTVTDPGTMLVARATGAGYWNGLIAELIVVDGVLSDEDRHTTEQYLLDKWAWSPADLSSLVGWWDETSPVIATGGKVSQWNNKAAGGHATQATALNQPATGATINGRPAVAFDGVDDYLQTPVTATPANVTILVVANITNVAVQRYLFGAGPAGAGGLNWLIEPTGIEKVISQVTAVIGNATNPVQPNAPQLLTFSRVNGGTWDFRHNGVANGNGTNALAWTGGDNLKISEGFGVSLLGSIGEIIICSTVLSAAVRDLAEQYLTAKWLPAWTPADVPGLVGWWDADDPTTVTENAGAVSSWDARAGRAGIEPFTQPSALAQPTIGVDTTTGNNVLTHGGSVQTKMETRWQPNVVGSYFTCYRVFGFSAEAKHALGSIYGWASYAPYGDTTNVFSTWGTSGGAPGSMDEGPVLAAAPAADDNLIWKVVVDATGCHQTVIGSGERVTRDTPYTPTSVNISGIVMGAVDPVYRFGGRYCAVVMVAGAIDPADDAQLEQFLTDQWGIT